MTGVRVRAWCRADLAGGTLDIWPLGVIHRDAVTVNLALDVAVTIELRLREDGGFVVNQSGETVSAPTARELAEQRETSLIGVIARRTDLPPAEISIASGSPRGGGLGASSALSVALLRAIEIVLDRPAVRPRETAALVRDLEASLMKLPTGVQDQYPALYGGALAIRYRTGGEEIESIETDLDRLASSLLVAYSGQSHFSAGSNWQVVRRRLDGDAATEAQFEGIAAVARAMPEALTAGDLETVGHLMSQEYQHRRQLADGIATPKVDGMLEAAVAAGAWGGKVCGAGGGGSIAVLAPPARREEVARALERAGGQLLLARPAAGGLAVTTLD